MQPSIAAFGTVVKLDTLTVYKQLDDETIATVAGDQVSIWFTDGDEAHKIGGIGRGTSGFTNEQLINKIWKD